MGPVNIPKKSALHLKLPFLDCTVVNGLYQGHLAEVIDIDPGSGLYKCIIRLAYSNLLKDFSPYEIIPTKDEFFKIKEILNTFLHSSNYYNTLKFDYEMIGLNKIKNCLQGLSSLQSQCEEMYRLMYSGVTTEEKELVYIFTNLIFDNIKKQYTKDLDEIKGQASPAFIVVDHDNNKIDKMTGIDPNTGVFNDYNVLYDQHRNDNLTMETKEALSYSHFGHISDELEYLENTFSKPLRTACEQLSLNYSPDFVNSHSMRMENIINTNHILFYELQETNLLITAYLFMYYYEMDIQIAYQLLPFQGYLQTANSDPRSIVDILLTFEFLKKQYNKISPFDLIIHYIDAFANAMGVKVEIKQKQTKSLKKSILMVVEKKRGDGTGYRHKKSGKVPESVVLLKPEVQESIRIPILNYMLKRVNNRIDNIYSSTYSASIHSLSTNRQREILLELSNYFKDNRALNRNELFSKFKKSEELNFVKDYLSEYNDRIKLTESEVTVKQKTHKNRLTAIGSPLKREIVNSIQDTVRKHLKELNAIDIAKNEYNILLQFSEDLSNPDLLYTHLGNPDYVKIIEPYLLSYEKAVSEKMKDLNSKNKVSVINKLSLETNINLKVNETQRQFVKTYNQKIHELINSNSEKHLETLKKIDHFKELLAKAKNVRDADSEENRKLRQSYVQTIREYKTKIDSTLDHARIKMYQKIMLNMNVISDYSNNEILYLKKYTEYYSFITSSIKKGGPSWYTTETVELLHVENENFDKQVSAITEKYIKEIHRLTFYSKDAEKVIKEMKVLSKFIQHGDPERNIFYLNETLILKTKLKKLVTNVASNIKKILSGTGLELKDSIEFNINGLKGAIDKRILALNIAYRESDDTVVLLELKNKIKALEKINKYLDDSVANIKKALEQKLATEKAKKSLQKTQMKIDVYQNILDEFKELFEVYQLNILALEQTLGYYQEVAALNKMKVVKQTIKVPNFEKYTDVITKNVKDSNLPDYVKNKFLGDRRDPKNIIPGTISKIPQTDPETILYYKEIIALHKRINVVKGDITEEAEMMSGLSNVKIGSKRKALEEPVTLAQKRREFDTEFRHSILKSKFSSKEKEYILANINAIKNLSTTQIKNLELNVKHSSDPLDKIKLDLNRFYTFKLAELTNNYNRAVRQRM